MKKRENAELVRSSAAEYLTFLSSAGDSETSIEVRYEDGQIWLTQKLMAQLYGVGANTVNYHLEQLYSDSELDNEATIRKIRIVQTEGSRQVQRSVLHYNLEAIIAVGFKVNSERAVQFRKWANIVVRDYTIQGWVLDDERLKKGGSALTEEYFEQLLERIREIRLSERKFYQKITDIYATAIDYDSSAKATQRFFAAIQNKMHYAVHGNTAAEVIAQRADAEKEHMGLTSWEGAPDGKIHKYDVTVAKNYLTKQELGELAKIVNSYLELAELQANRGIPMTMADWEERLTAFLELVNPDVLRDAGKVSAAMAKLHAETEFEKYRITQDALYRSDFDRFVALEEAIAPTSSSQTANEQ